MKLIALHGFLGLPNDWSFLQCEAVDIFRFPAESLLSWAQNFNNSIAEPSFLIGYSMGARLAMHAILERPDLWKGAIFISGHPGLDSDEGRRMRQVRDEEWAKRFLHEPWDPLMNAWNRQPVFQGSRSLIRREADYSRTKLAGALTHFSLGKQENLLKPLLACPIPQLYLAGELDLSCKILMQQFPRHSVIAQAGHRLLWDNPKQLLKQITEFTIC